MKIINTYIFSFFLFKKKNKQIHFIVWFALVCSFVRSMIRGAVVVLSDNVELQSTMSNAWFTLALFHICTHLLYVSVGFPTFVIHQLCRLKRIEVCCAIIHCTTCIRNYRKCIRYRLNFALSFFPSFFLLCFSSFSFVVAHFFAFLNSSRFIFSIYLGDVLLPFDRTKWVCVDDDDDFFFVCCCVPCQII